MIEVHIWIALFDSSPHTDDCEWDRRLLEVKKCCDRVDGEHGIVASLSSLEALPLTVTVNGYVEDITVVNRCVHEILEIFPDAYGQLTKIADSVSTTTIGAIPNEENS